MLKKLRLNNSGFTLIELLIVIVIIGILAGVVIGVLNPVQQQNRARDASMQSSINKMALASKSLFVSSPRTNNRAPTPVEFAAGVGNYVNATLGGTEDCATGANASVHGPADGAIQCHFLVSGLTTPDTCDTVYNGASATGATQCHFVYYRDDATTNTDDEFRIGVRGYATPQRMFIYYYHEDQSAGGSVTEDFFNCPADMDIDAPYDSAPAAAGDLVFDCDRLN